MKKADVKPNPLKRQNKKSIIGAESRREHCLKILRIEVTTGIEYKAGSECE